MSRAARIATTVPVVLVLLACVFAAATTFKQNLAFTALEAEVSFWGRGSYLPGTATRQRTDQGLLSLVTAAPAHPDYLGLRANQLAWESFWAADEVNKQKYAQSAAHMQYNALQNRPAQLQGWVKLERYAAGMENGADLTALARARQQALQPEAAAL